MFTDDVDLKLKIKLDRKKTTAVHAKDPSRTVVTRIIVPPGAQFPWHIDEADRQTVASTVQAAAAACPWTGGTHA